MSTPSYTTGQTDGRRWSIDESGASAITRTYYVILSEPLPSDGELTSVTGVPAIGTAHTSISGLYVVGYDIEEGTEAERIRLKVTVKYARREFNSDQGANDSIVDEWGWDSSTEEKELTTAADSSGTPVLNSAGDPFESVPTVSAPAPVFTKVIKFKTRQSSAMGFNCKTNDSSVTIGGMSCAANSLLATVAEKRIIGSSVYKYQYTVQLKYKTNKVVIAGTGSPVDIGWDVAITDAGMREKTDSGDMRIIKTVDHETMTPCPVTSPELLDGSGHAISRSASGQESVVPYNLRFQAYESGSFPSWFYSEPS